MGNCIQALKLRLLDPTDISIHDLSKQKEALLAQRQLLVATISKDNPTAWDQSRLMTIDARLKIINSALEKRVETEASRTTRALADTISYIRASSDAPHNLDENAIASAASEIEAAQRVRTARLQAIIGDSGRSSSRHGYVQFEHGDSATLEEEEEDADDGLGGSARLLVPAVPL